MVVGMGLLKLIISEIVASRDLRDEIGVRGPSPASCDRQYFILSFEE